MKIGILTALERMKALPLALLTLTALFGVSCETLQQTETEPEVTPPKPPAPAYRETGVVYRGKASWYSIKTNGGYATASGERFNHWADTAAHKSLPMGTRVKVTNLVNGRDKVVRINDRGPYITGRIIDVSLGVAHDLDFVNRGVVPVTVEVMKKSSAPKPAPTPPPAPQRNGWLFGRSVAQTGSKPAPASSEKADAGRNGAANSLAGLFRGAGGNNSARKRNGRVTATPVGRSEPRLSVRLGNVGKSLKATFSQRQK